MPAITLENVSKTYHRGKVRRGDIRQSLSYWWQTMWSPSENFDALKDINLIVEPGEILGIVGPNGAGKSTLLKLLSRITYPTTGRITINGTLSSLLEVGIGFHPDLTGRENIYLNGAILGMKRREIDSKLDSIVEFSGLEKYLETPVKQYSSGMYVRLAFAISAHLDTDILLLDEVLGVGDIEFKRKSIEKLTEKLSSGKTIIMVSHQLDLLKSLCNKGIYIKDGQIKATGPIEEVSEKYILDSDTVEENDLMHRLDRMGSGKVRVTGIQALDVKGNVIPILHSGQEVVFAVTLKSAEPVLRNVEIRLDVFDKMGQSWFVLNNNISNGMIEQCPGNVVLQCKIPKLPLSEGTFSMNVSLSVNFEKCDFVQHAYEFKVERGGFYKTGRLPAYARGVLVDYNWDLK